MNPSPDPKSTAPTRAFTLIELLVVISIIAVLASLVVGLGGMAGRKNKEAKVKAELNQLITAIESYKAHFGYYPPDNASIVGSVTNVNPLINQLFYELNGTIVDNEARTFRVPDMPSAVSSAFVKNEFNRDGFVNATPTVDESGKANQVRSFLSTKGKQVREIMGRSTRIKVLAVPVDWPANRLDQPTNVKQVNPWRYVSTNPTNNPNSFDLWAEIVIGKDKKLIGNWKE